MKDGRLKNIKSTKATFGKFFNKTIVKEIK
ncbi:MAG: hypothetical protein OD816_000163 [Thermodesulfobacterium sp.]|uniref:Uncharacterized protein n=1 Tax=Candidatus Thermodesulfobacterium syntrophicum TaxID=3060442 RepID=A0AAE3TFF9_9BACT|nr:hypothetical protein [Candidatus Thermodesulfobacterium syntrophicum]